MEINTTFPHQRGCGHLGLADAGDDRRTFLGALEFVARGRVQLCEIVGAVVGQRVPLEPDPQILDRIEVRSVGLSALWAISRIDGLATRLNTSQGRINRHVSDLKTPCHGGIKPAGT